MPWFPILLAVGVGGRLLGRGRGFALGLVCAMFWIVLVQASAGTGVWRQGWVVVTMLIGAAAIFLMGGWAGQMPPDTQRDPGASVGTPIRTPSDGLSQMRNERCHAERSEASPSREQTLRFAQGDKHSAFRIPPEATIALDRIATVIQQFDDWLVEHRDDNDPWPAFGEFIRGALFQCCRATHVKPYCLLSEGEELAPLREPDHPSSPLTKGGKRRVSARQGILGHVVTTGRSYVEGDRTQGELIGELIGPIGPIGPIVWCFAVTQGTKRLGAITAGQLDIVPADNLALLRAVEQLVAQCWCLLAETVHSRIVGQDDPGSGLCNRTAFLQAAEQSLRESYAQGEPVAIAVIAVEGIRELNDAGRWEVADELIREVADSLRRKVRMDDRLGRFDGSRFIWLLRRVDAELASLIVKQMMARLTTLCGDRTPLDPPFIRGEAGVSPSLPRWDRGGSITVRCGVVGSGTENPDLRALVTRALVQSRRARLEQVTIAGELDAQAATMER